MRKITVKFDVPDWVNDGLAKGDYEIFGGIVRKKSGEIIYHLKNAAQVTSKKYIVIAGVVIVLAGVGCYIYKKINKKAVLQEKAKYIESGIQKYIFDVSSQNFNIDDIKKLSQDLDEFVGLCNRLEVDGSSLFARGDMALRLTDLYRAIQGFNIKLSEMYNMRLAQPLKVDMSVNDTLREIKVNLVRQVELIERSSSKEE